MLDVLEPAMPPGLPRYLMGVGYPEDLVESVRRGVDMFDCVAPTRNGRNGTAFTRDGRVNVKRADLAADVRKVMVCTDLTEPVLAEAARAKAQMVVAHHPIIFKSIQRVTASEAPVVYEAVRRGLAVYAAHTNLDAAPGGTNDVLADVLRLTNRRPLEPIVRRDQCKVVVFIPPDSLSAVAALLTGFTAVLALELYPVATPWEPIAFPWKMLAATALAFAVCCLGRRRGSAAQH